MNRRAFVQTMTAASLVAAGVSHATAQEVASLQIHSSRYIVIDAGNGDIYAQRNAHKHVAIASLTKIFTAVQAVNMAPLSTKITTKESDLQSAAATTMGFGPAETYTLEDMIYGMLLPSGNDAAWAIARSLGYQEGDTDDEAAMRFVQLVNERVTAMGLNDTTFKNPDGWGVKGHHSSAADVAAFMQYATGFPFLIDVMGTYQYTTSNGALTVTNSNKVLNSYGSLIGGKTGYDDDAGWCLAQLAGNGDDRMIAVTLDGIAPDDWYDDNITLLDYAFQRKSELAAADQAFDGDVITWTDPSPKLFADASKPVASLTGHEGQEPANFAQPEDTGERRAIPMTEQDRLPIGGSGMAVPLIAASALVAIRGARHWSAVGGTWNRLTSLHKSALVDKSSAGA